MTALLGPPRATKADAVGDSSGEEHRPYKPGDAGSIPARPTTEATP